MHITPPQTLYDSLERIKYAINEEIDICRQYDCEPNSCFQTLFDAVHNAQKKLFTGLVQEQKEG